MSLAAIKWARALKLPRSDKAVLVDLAHCADKTNTSWPSHSAIAERLGCHVHTVERALKRLYAAGIVKRQDRFGKSGRRVSNTYLLQVGSVAQNTSASPPQIAGEGTPPNWGGGYPPKLAPCLPPKLAPSTSLNDSLEGFRKKESKRETPPASKPKTAPAKRYAFDGVVIRLNEADYERWRKLFHFLPDFEVELQRADGYYASREGGRRNWFHRVSRWLAKANEEARQDDWHTYAGLDFSTPEAKQRWYAQHEAAKRLVADSQVAA